MIDETLLQELIGFSIITVVVVALGLFGHYYANKLNNKKE
jgi:hypothetical protein